MIGHFPLDDRTRELASRLVWFESPEQALAEPVRFVAYAFRYARSADMQVLRSYVSDDELRFALQHAPPGIIDPRSWAYWHLMLDMDAAPMPERRIA